MLEIALNGERLSQTQYNDSVAKQHYSFAKSKRFAKSKPSFETEFKYEVSYDLATPSKVQKELEFRKHVVKPAFGTVAARIQKIFMPVAPSPDTYHPRLLPKSKSCTFGIGREVV